MKENQSDVKGSDEVTESSENKDSSKKEEGDKA